MVPALIIFTSLVPSSRLTIIGHRSLHEGCQNCTHMSTEYEHIGEKVERQSFRERAEMNLENPDRDCSVDLRELLGR